jgi:hypothetical protein
MSSDYTKHLYTWLKIREENGFDFPKDRISLDCDARHSALLDRLFQGKEPLPEPPPKAFSYPWYKLIEDGYAYPYEVWEPHPTLHPFPALVIDQHPWKIIEKVSDREWICTYSISPRFHPRTEFVQGRWRIYQIGSNITKYTASNGSKFLWKIEKVVN